MSHSDSEDYFTQPDPKVGAVCQQFLLEEETITVRAVARRLGIAHTTITRDAARKDQVDRCAALQSAARRIAQTHRGRIRAEESLDLAKARLRIEKLEREKALLLASHKAMLMAVGELGGMEGWKRLFPAYLTTEAELRAMDAMPDATVTPIEGENEGR